MDNEIKLKILDELFSVLEDPIYIQLIGLDCAAISNSDDHWWSFQVMDAAVPH